MALPPFIEQGDSLWSYFPNATGHLQSVGVPAFLTDTFRGPGYPFLLALVSHLAGNLPAATRLINAVGWPLWLALVALGLRRAAGPRLALIALLLLSLSDGLIFLYQEPGTDLPFAILSAGALLAGLSRSRRAWLVAGVITGLAILTRFQGVVILGSLAICSPLIWIRGRSDIRPWLVALAGFVLSCGLLISPYLYLNNLYQGSPLFSSTIANVPDDWLPEGVVRLDAGSSLFLDTPTSHEQLTSIPRLIALDPARVLGKWTEQATVVLITERLPCILPGDGCTSLLARILAWLAPLGLLILLWRPSRRLLLLIGVCLALLWTSVAIPFREARHLLLVLPLACLALAAVLWLVAVGLVHFARTIRQRLGPSAGEPALLGEPLSESQSVGVAVGLAVSILFVGGLVTWLPFVPGSSLNRLLNDWSLPSAAQREVPAFLAADAQTGGWRPVADVKYWVPLTWFLPAETGGRFQTVWPDSPLNGTSPYQVYEKFLWTAVVRQDGRIAGDTGWDDRLPLDIPPESELIYYKPDFLQAAVTRRLATNIRAGIRTVTASSTAPASGTVAFGSELIADDDPLTGWKSTPAPIDPTASESIELALVQASMPPLEVEDFAGVTASSEYPLIQTTGTWLIWHWQAWMSNNGVALLLRGNGPAPSLSRPIDLEPGRYEVTLRVLALGAGPVRVRLVLGQTDSVFADVVPSEQPVTLTQTISLAAPAQELRLTLDELGPRGLALDTLTIRRLDSGPTINRVWLMPWPDGGLAGDLRVDVSLDGASWRTVAHQTGLHQVRQSPVVLEFPETPAAYLRVTGRQLNTTSGRPPSDPDQRQWLGFIEARVSLSRESPWARMAPSVEVGPDLQISPDGWVTATVTNTSPITLSVDVQLLIDDRVPGVWIPVHRVTPELPPGEARQVALSIPGERFILGKHDLEVWVDQNALTREGRQIRRASLVVPPGIRKLEVDGFPTLARAPDYTWPNPPANRWLIWGYQPWMSGNRVAALIGGPGEKPTLRQTINLAPGQYLVTLRALTAGAGSVQIRLRMGESDAVFAWDGPQEKPVTVIQSLLLESPIRQLDLVLETLGARAVALDSLTFQLVSSSG